MARQRKSKLEKLATEQVKAQQKARDVAALRRELMAEERARDWQRKGRAGGAVFADAKRNKASQDFLADILHRAALNSKDGKQFLEIEKYVRDGCPKFDIDAAVEEILKKMETEKSAKKEEPPASPLTPVAYRPKPGERRPSLDR